MPVDPTDVPPEDVATSTQSSKKKKKKAKKAAATDSSSSAKEPYASIPPEPETPVQEKSINEETEQATPSKSKKKKDKKKKKEKEKAAAAAAAAAAVAGAEGEAAAVAASVDEDKTQHVPETNHTNDADEFVAAKELTPANDKTEPEATARTILDEETGASKSGESPNVVLEKPTAEEVPTVPQEKPIQKSDQQLEESVEAPASDSVKSKKSAEELNSSKASTGVTLQQLSKNAGIETETPIEPEKSVEASQDSFSENQSTETAAQSSAQANVKESPIVATKETSEVVESIESRAQKPKPEPLEKIVSEASEVESPSLNITPEKSTTIETGEEFSSRNPGTEVQKADTKADKVTEVAPIAAKDANIKASAAENIPSEELEAEETAFKLPGAATTATVPDVQAFTEASDAQVPLEIAAADVITSELAETKESTISKEIAEEPSELNDVVFDAMALKESVVQKKPVAEKEAIEQAVSQTASEPTSKEFISEHVSEQPNENIEKSIESEETMSKDEALKSTAQGLTEKAQARTEIPASPGASEKSTHEEPHLPDMSLAKGVEDISIASSAKKPATIEDSTDAKDPTITESSTGIKSSTDGNEAATANDSGSVEESVDREAESDVIELAGAEKPVDVVELAATEGPMASKNLATSEEPSTTEEFVIAEESVASEEPNPADEPVIAEPPTMEDPETTESLFDTEMATKEKLSAQGASTTEEFVITENPSATEGKITEEKLAVNEDVLPTGESAVREAVSETGQSVVDNPVSQMTLSSDPLAETSVQSSQETPIAEELETVNKLDEEHKIELTPTEDLENVPTADATDSSPLQEFEISKASDNHPATKTYGSEDNDTEAESIGPKNEELVKQTQNILAGSVTQPSTEIPEDIAEKTPNTIKPVASTDAIGEAFASIGNKENLSMETEIPSPAADSKLFNAESLNATDKNTENNKNPGKNVEEPEPEVPEDKATNLREDVPESKESEKSGNSNDAEQAPISQNEEENLGEKISVATPLGNDTVDVLQEPVFQESVKNVATSSEFEPIILAENINSTVEDTLTDLDPEKELKATIMDFGENYGPGATSSTAESDIDTKTEALKTDKNTGLPGDSVQSKTGNEIVDEISDIQDASAKTVDSDSKAEAFEISSEHEIDEANLQKEATNEQENSEGEIKAEAQPSSTINNVDAETNSVVNAFQQEELASTEPSAVVETTELEPKAETIDAQFKPEPKAGDPFVQPVINEKDIPTSSESIPVYSQSCSSLEKQEQAEKLVERDPARPSAEEDSLLPKKPVKVSAITNDAEITETGQDSRPEDQVADFQQTPVSEGETKTEDASLAKTESVRVSTESETEIIPNQAIGTTVEPVQKIKNSEAVNPEKPLFEHETCVNKAQAENFSIDYQANDTFFKEEPVSTYMPVEIMEKSASDTPKVQPQEDPQFQDTKESRKSEKTSNELDSTLKPEEIIEQVDSTTKAQNKVIQLEEDTKEQGISPQADAESVVSDTESKKDHLPGNHGKQPSY